MPKNDAFLLDGIIDAFVFDDNPNLDPGERFEFLCLEQILKSYDLNQEDIKSGHTDGRLDGGIDGAYVFVNGQIYDGSRQVHLPKSDGVIEVVIASCKKEAKFQETTLNALIATCGELFDFSLEDSIIQNRYNNNVMSFRSNLKSIYKQMAIYSPKVRIYCYYATRGDADKVGSTIPERAQQIEREISDNFRDCECRFHFWGAAEILAAYRKQRSMMLEIPVVRDLSEDGKCFIALCKIGDFYKFLCDEDGSLRRYLMDANIRDYLGNNKVNVDIHATLQDVGKTEFWWLNNGVTILASSATVIAGRLIAKDIQIINGLQTSQTIFHHFNSGRTESAEKSLMVKVIVSDDKALSDRIIVASNNQTLVEQSALRATDKTQRNIEDALEANGWFYERRSNYFKNIGKPESRIISPMYLAGAYVAVCMKNPTASANLRSKFMRSDRNYQAVFRDDFPLNLWTTLIEIQRASEGKLSNFRRSSSVRQERFLKSWRGLLSLLTVGRVLGTLDFPPDDLSKFSVDATYYNVLDEVWDFLEPTVTAGDRLNAATLASVLRDYEARFGVEKISAVGKQSPNQSYDLRGLARHPHPERRSGSRSVSEEIDSHFLDQVDMLLPLQPWPKGVHLEVASKLLCPPKKVTAAIKKLIEGGRRQEQIDGVVFPASDPV